VFSLLLSLQLGGQVKITRDGDRIIVDVQGKPFTALYITGAETTKPYFHPVRAATGTIVTRRYPMESLEGELRNEKHQRGLWFSHGDVNGFDFWDNEASYTTTNRGFIVLDRVLGLVGGDKTGSIDARFKWVDPKQKVLIEETRKMVIYSDPTLRTIDFDIVLRAIEKVTFNLRDAAGSGSGSAHEKCPGAAKTNRHHGELEWSGERGKLLGKARQLG